MKELTDTLQNFGRPARKIESGLRPRRGVLGAAFASLMVVFTHVAMAQTNLVTNGTFAITGGCQSFQFGTYNGYTPSDSAERNGHLTGALTTQPHKQRAPQRPLCPGAGHHADMPGIRFVQVCTWDELCERDGRLRRHDPVPVWHRHERRNA